LLYFKEADWHYAPVSRGAGRRKADVLRLYPMNLIRLIPAEGSDTTKLPPPHGREFFAFWRMQRCGKVEWWNDGLQRKLFIVDLGVIANYPIFQHFIIPENPMFLTVNGEKVEHRGDGTVPALLAELGATPEHTALTVNGDLVFSKQWNDFKFTDGDTVEVLTFVGGG
jgi:thiamine biosynthesis protein ThiS